MKITLVTILGIFLLPFLAGAAGGPFTITSLTNGFVITENEDIPIGTVTNKGFWEDQILKLGGKITVHTSAGGKTVSQPIEWLAPVVPRNPAARITVYGGGVVLDANPLRGRTALPLIILVEARNQNGKVIASSEVKGTIVPAYRFTIAPSTNTPLSTYYERGDTGKNFSAIVFATGPYDPIGVQQITLTRDGGTDTDLLNIQLFDGSTRIGTASSFLDGKAVINLDFLLVIPEGANKTLTIKADIDSNANTYRIQDGISLGIATSSDVRAIEMGTGNIIELADFIPVFGNRMGIQ